MILDADGQDPPELIPRFVEKWREGHDDVHGSRSSREGETWLKKATAHVFYRVMQRLSKTPIPTDTGDFRLLSPRALAALRQLRERRSEERRVGKECVSKCETRGAPDH